MKSDCDADLWQLALTLRVTLAEVAQRTWDMGEWTRDKDAVAVLQLVLVLPCELAGGGKLPEVCLKGTRTLVERF